jgi:hypothetical protein
MKDLETALLDRFRHEAHLKFMGTTRTLITQSPRVEQVVAEQLPTFDLFLSQAGTLVDATRKSDLTAQIKKADRRIDRDITGIRKAVESYVHHFNPETVSFAVSLQNRFKAFGDIAKKSYTEESAAMGILLTDLQTTYAPQIAALNLGGWITELVEATAEFEALLAQRTSEQAEVPVGNIPEVRRNLNKVYRTSMGLIKATITLKSTDTELLDACKAFFMQLNSVITYFNEHNDHGKTRRDISTATVEPIATQLYTGEPVIVLPTVFYEGKKLVFSVDYTVTYRQNLNVGTADLIIKGKGAYKGRRTVTFNIVTNG